MIKETKTTQEIVIKHKYCDVCGSEMKFGMACNIAKCKKCHKDLCDKCVAHENDTMGDYREVYCKVCWQIGEPYRKEIHKHENEIEKLNEQWTNRCVGLFLFY